jgi:hypothetical protein
MLVAMARPGDTSGQAASEYVALVALVAVVLALAAGLTSGGVGGQVLAGLQRGLCRVAGGSCPQSQLPRADLAPCPLERTTSSESLGGAFEVVKLDHGATLSAVRGSDGRVKVTLADATSAGGELGIGLRVGVGRAHGPRATAGLGVSVAGGRSWTLPDAAAARAFVDRYGSKATIGGQAVDLVRSGCSLLCDAIGWRPHAALPPADEWYVDQGAAAQLEASLGDATMRAGIGGLLGASMRSDGSRTWYLQLDASTGASVVGAAAGAQATALVSYTLDAQRRPTELVVGTVARGGAGGALAGAHGGSSAAVGAAGALVTEHVATLDLRDPGNRAVAAAFVAALRDPHALVRLRERAAAVRERIARTGVVDRRTYALSSSAYELGARFALGAQLGAGFGRTREGMRLLTAETRLPGLPFLPRDDCRAA